MCSQPSILLSAASAILLADAKGAKAGLSWRDLRHDPSACSGQAEVVPSRRPYRRERVEFDEGFAHVVVETEGLFFPVGEGTPQAFEKAEELSGVGKGAPRT